MHTLRSVAALLLLAVLGVPAHSQGLREQFTNLFVFGSGGIQLFLPGTADPNNPASTQAHGSHFIPATVDANGALISFLGNAIASSAARTPLSAASSGTTFRFVDGAPVATSISSGPLFAERAQTLGKGRVFVGFNRTSASYSSLRGVPLNDLRLIFTHQNVTEASSPGCSAAQAGDCDLMGIPRLENDLMMFTLALDVNVDVTSFFVTYGLSDRIDLSFALPVVSAALTGTSNAEIVPFGGPPAVHFFDGTETVPVLHASSAVNGSATGVGDVSTRLKFNLGQNDRTGFAVLLDARFPTGSEEDLLGTGHFAGAILGDVVLDQHFVRRKRHNRLMSLVLEREPWLGAGIDESTALIVEPDGTWRVSGASVVVIYDARGAQRTDPAERVLPLGGTGIVVHVLPRGGRFDPRTGEARLASPPR